MASVLSGEVNILPHVSAITSGMRKEHFESA